MVANESPIRFKACQHGTLLRCPTRFPSSSFQPSAARQPQPSPLDQGGVLRQQRIDLKVLERHEVRVQLVKQAVARADHLCHSG